MTRIAIMVLFANVAYALVVAVAWPPWKRNDIPDIFDARYEHDKTLEAEAKASVGHRSVSPEIHVPRKVLGFEAKLFDAALKQVEALLAGRSTHQFPNAWHEHIHGFYSPTLRGVWVRLAHVKCLDVDGVVGEDNGLLEHLLGQESARARCRGRYPTRASLRICPFSDSWARSRSRSRACT